MKIYRFEEILSWKKARDLTLEIYSILRTNKDFGYKDQIQRATVSIMNNIAEGFERKGNKEFKNFLFIAKGSCGELRSMLYVAKDLSYLNEVQFIKLLNLSYEISRLLSALIKTL